MGRLQRLVLGAGLSVLAASANAGTQGPGYVSALVIQPTIIFFSTSGVRSGAPACATASSRFVFDNNTVRGQELLALLLTAYSTGRTVSVGGTGDCSTYSDTEGVYNITM
jgi:hypothetical protein